MTEASRAAAALFLLSTGLAAAQAPDPSYLRRQVEALDSGSEDARRNAAATLRAEGEGAIDALVDGFGEASVRSRRARAGLLAERGDVRALQAALDRIGDPDAFVRAEWARLLGRRDLPRETAAARVAALSRLAADRDEALRERALESLRSIGDPTAGRALADLAIDPDPAVREDAIRHLARAPAARPWVPEVALALERGAPRSFRQILLALGDAVAVRDAGGDEDAVEGTTALLARHWRDLDREVALLARSAFVAWVEGLDARGLSDRAAARIEEMARRTGDPAVPIGHPEEWERALDSIGLDLLVGRLAEQHLFETRDLDRAREAARALAARGEGIEGPRGLRARARGLAYEATCDLLVGRSAEADERLRRAADLLERSLREEIEGASRPPDGSLFGTFAFVQVAMLRSLNALLHPSETPSVEARSPAREAFRLAWERYTEIDDRRPFDAVLLRDLGVERVVKEALLSRCGPDSAAHVLRTLAAWLHEAAPDEYLPVEAPAPGADRRGPGETRALSLSTYPLRVAEFEASVLGRQEEGLALLDRLVESLQASQPLSAAVDELLAEVQIARGQVLLELRRGDEADRALRAGVRVLEELVEMIGDPRGVRRRRLSAAHITLAVNENVVQGNRAAAREHCRRALELADNDFTRVLYACYLARDGQREEALEELGRVPLGPDTFYNAACTYALVGEVDAAFDALQRDFEDRGSSGRSLDAHRDWAWKDPDLGRLRPDPRFREIVGPPPAPPGP